MTGMPGDRRHRRDSRLDRGARSVSEFLWDAICIAVIMMLLFVGLTQVHP